MVALAAVAMVGAATALVGAETGAEVLEVAVMAVVARVAAVMAVLTAAAMEVEVRAAVACREDVQTPGAISRTHYRHSKHTPRSRISACLERRIHEPQHSR